jgi:hypothetical protein
MCFADLRCIQNLARDEARSRQRKLILEGRNDS